MKRITLAAVVACMFSAAPAHALVGSSIGIGLHYLRSLGDFEEDEVSFDKDNFGILGSYQFGVPLVSIEANVEWVFDYLGTDETLIEPSLYAVTNGMIYVGAGIGIGHINDRWLNDPFYALRGGVNVGLGGLGLDVYTTYRFQSDDELEDLTGDDLDSLTFAAVLRKSLGG